jgi:iron complex transport system substrate-binding protein
MKKICSLLPSGTEILFALGLGDQVIGVSDTCDYPPEAKSKRILSRSLVDPSNLSSAEVEEKMQEILQRGRSPFIIEIDSLSSEKPDLIVTQDVCYVCDVNAKDVIDLTRLFEPPPEVMVLSSRTLSDVFENIKRLGEATDRREKAEELTKDLRNRINVVAEKTASCTYKPRVLSLEGVNPLVTGGNWLPEMKLLAGGIDGLFTPGCPSKRISWDDVLIYSPQVLVIALCSSSIGRSLKEMTWLVKQDGWWKLPAVEKGEVYVIDHAYFSTPGPRLVDGVEILAQILHPDLFSDMIPKDAVVKIEGNRPIGCQPDKIGSYFHPYV